MNLRIILQLLRTDWLRLRWLILGAWITMLAAAWPALTFSPDRFDNPSSLSFPYLNNEIGAALLNQGEFSPKVDWFFATLQWTRDGAWILLAGTIGFHSWRWVSGKPVGKCDAVLSRVAALSLFVLVPMLLMAPVVSIYQDLGLHGALASLVASARIRVPGILVASLFGALCGNGWRWLVGVFAFFVMSFVTPLLLRTENPAYLLFSGCPVAWLAVAALAGLLIFTSRDVNAVRRIATAIVIVTLVPVLQPKKTKNVESATKLPDWSTSVRPVLASSELSGIITREPDLWLYPSIPTEAPTPKLQLQLDWRTSGLPPGVFSSWTSGTNGKIISGGKVISSGAPVGRDTMMVSRGGHGGLEKEALTVAVEPGANPVKWIDLRGMIDVKSRALALFEPIKHPGFSAARIEMDLAGAAYRIVKLLDVPFGQPVRADIDGVTIHIRRLDLDEYQPVGDVCFTHSVVSRSQGKWGGRGLPDYDWIPVLHLPDTGEYRLLDWAYESRSQLVPGCEAVRRMFWTCRRVYGQKPDLKGFENARLLLLRREDLAEMHSHFRSDDLPLDVLEYGEKPPDARGSRQAPPFRLRPDPAKTSPYVFDRWMVRSYDAFDFKGWDSRNIADFVPTHLNQILIRKAAVRPPSTPEGKAIALACPESRRNEIIDAFSRKQDPDSNWLPDLILRRGWTNEAAPQIREMAAQHKIGANPYSQLMTMMLEDPQTYPAILENRMWFEIYEQARRLPGIEPLMTDALTKQFHEDLTNEEGDSRAKIFRYLPAAAHGLPDAFSACLNAWPSTKQQDRRIVGEYLKQIMVIHGVSGDWDATKSALDTKSPADFRYDPLARCWVLVSDASH